MDDSDKENSTELAQLKHIGPGEGESNHQIQSLSSQLELSVVVSGARRARKNS